MSPLLLVLLALLIGLFPETVAGRLVRVASAAVLGGPIEEKFYLALWHGFTPALWMSVAIIGFGALWLLAYRLTRRGWDALPVPRAKAYFDATIDGVSGLSKQVTEGLHNGSLPRYVCALMLATVIAGGLGFFQHWPDVAPGDRIPHPVYFIGVVGIALMLVPSLYVAFRHGNRLVALVVINVLGLMTTLTFIYFSAPDLALTQISVEVVTLILMLLALYFLPKREASPAAAEGDRPGRRRSWTRVTLAAVGGVGIGMISWLVMSHEPDNKMSEYYWLNAVIGSGGHNVVNVILVDFRGFDTFGEIMVLGIAALIIFAMLEGMVLGPLRQQVSAWRSGELYSPTRHPLLMVVVTRLMLPLALMVAIFIFIRGHNDPGGGFIAALVVAIALVMQYMASGFGWAERQIQFNYHALIGGGGLIAAATGIASLVVGKPFLKSGFKHFHFPVVGDFELSSALAFDLGVFLTVVGGVMLALAQFSKLGDLSRADKVNDGPMDYLPPPQEKP